MRSEDLEYLIDTVAIVIMFVALVIALALGGCAPIDPACVIKQGSDQPAECRSGR